MVFGSMMHQMTCIWTLDYGCEGKVRKKVRGFALASDRMFLIKI